MAVVVYIPQLEAVVALVMCTAVPVPAANTEKLQLNVWLPTAPVMEHVPGPLYAGLMFQLIPVPDGNEAFSVVASAGAA